MKKSHAGSKSSPTTRLTDSAARLMVSNLCKKHSAFLAFYSDNKTAIDAITITWTINGYARKEGNSSPATNTIILKKYPKSPEDARIVAHEIVHLLLWNEGYPYIVANPQTDDDSPRLFHDLALALQEPVYEPLVESRIKKYFRKLCSDNAKDAIKGLSKFIENKENVHVKIADPRSLLYYSCGYAKWCLLLEATCDKEKTAEYSRKFTHHFGSDIVPCAEKIVAAIKKYSTCSPESVIMIFETLLQDDAWKFDYQYQDEFNRFVINR